MHYQLCKQHAQLSGIDVSFFLYETTPESIRAMLPPPLEAILPSIVTINSWVLESSKGSPPITGIAVFVPCKYGLLSGAYCVAASVNADLGHYGNNIASIPINKGETTHIRKDSHVEIRVEGRQNEYISIGSDLDEPANIIEMSKELRAFFFYDHLYRGESSIVTKHMLMGAYFNLRYNALEKSSSEIQFMVSNHGIIERLEYLKPVAFLYGNIDINYQFEQLQTVHSNVA